jgi:hypothetical protein
MVINITRNLIDGPLKTGCTDIDHFSLILGHRGRIINSNMGGSKTIKRFFFFFLFLLLLG